MMSTQENRSRHRQVRTTLERGYPTNVKNEEWRQIPPLLPKQAKTGRLSSVGVVDGQCVKAPGIRARGYDANKKLSGHKRYIAVETDRRFLAISLKPADIAGLHWSTTGA
ncbi:hypothetical protein ACQ4WY_25260 [Janthinobacterium sp. LB2P49]|uniref:hypothetical protein n=1 Tax=Janthinobacterium sp. LB2P49 TaxID=3424198 RepID=UPI003F212B54